MAQHRAWITLRTCWIETNELLRGKSISLDPLHGFENLSFFRVILFQKVKKNTELHYNQILEADFNRNRIVGKSTSIRANDHLSLSH